MVVLTDSLKELAMKPNPAQQATVETLRTAAKRLRLGVEGQRTADELEAIADSMEAARELTAAQGVDECSAISTGHKFGPFGPDRSVQCEYCGESPPQPIEPQDKDMETNEHAEMLALANKIVASAHPEEDGRLEVAYAIARHLGLDWPSAYDRPIEPQGAVVGEAMADLFLSIFEGVPSHPRAPSKIARARAALQTFIETALPVAVGAGEDTTHVAILREHDTLEESAVVVPAGQSLDFDEDDATRKWLWPYLNSKRHLSRFVPIRTPATPAGKGDAK